MSTLSTYLIILLSLLFSGCKMASSLLDETLNPKSHNYTQSSKLLDACNLNQVIEVLQNNKNIFLQNSEKGLAYYYQNNSKKSNNYFDDAINIYRANENKALFDVSTFLTQEYQGEGYDKVFLHNYKAINYLTLGNSQSARVEARNSNIVQQESRLKLNKLKSSETNSSNGIALSRYDKLFQTVNSQHNPYQNPFAYYISALAYAEDADYGNALVDIRHAITFAPNSKILQEKLKLYRSKKRIDSVELFFDIGQSPLKSKVQLEMKMGNGEKRMATLPTFSLSESNIDHIEIVDNKGILVAKTSLLSDVNAIKINEFKEKLPAMLSLISRELALSVGSEALNGQSKLLAGVVKAGMAIYSQVDTATWSLLPQKILVASFKATKNQSYKMVIYSKDGTILKKYPLGISKKSSTKNIYKHILLRNNRVCY
jgi:hypothetical protein